jgi:hypothetical protein
MTVNVASNNQSGTDTVANILLSQVKCNAASMGGIAASMGGIIYSKFLT